MNPYERFIWDCGALGVEPEEPSADEQIATVQRARPRQRHRHERGHVRHQRERAWQRAMGRAVRAVGNVPQYPWADGKWHQWVGNLARRLAKDRAPCSCSHCRNHVGPVSLMARRLRDADAADLEDALDSTVRVEWVPLCLSPREEEWQAMAEANEQEALRWMTEATAEFAGGYYEWWTQVRRGQQGSELVGGA